MPKSYPSEFRARALALVKAGRPVSVVASDLGISAAALYRWREQELIDTGLKPGASTVASAALVAARRRIRELETEVEILNRATERFKDVVPPKERCGLVADLAAEGIPVNVSCRVLKVSAAGYYNWRKRPPSQRAIRHAWLTDVISAAHTDSRGTYGSRRIHAELVKGQGLVVGYHQVSMLMARAGLSGVPNRRTRFKASGPATAVDLVDRLFARTAPDQLWVTDITEHRTREGKIYCCVVLDAYSRRVVGWSINSIQDAALTTSALGMAINSRQPGPQTIIHSDHGVQFTSWAFTDRAKKAGLLPSMGSIGDCYDNAVIESFWGRMQTELLNKKRWNTRVELANAIFEYIEVFHNRRRRHSSLGMLTPIEFEKLVQSPSQVA